MGDAKSDQPGPAGISLPRIVGLALRTYRQQFGRVATTAFVVFGAVATIDAVTVVLVVDRHVSRPAGAALTSVIGGVVAMVGVVIYAGILDKVVGAHLHGHPDLTLRQIAQSLPFGRLVGADIVLAFATLVGLALFVVPGIVIFTFWSLVGPVITIETVECDRAFGARVRTDRTDRGSGRCVVEQSDVAHLLVSVQRG